VLLGNLDNGLGLEHGAARATERAISHDVDALLVAEVDDLLLREGRVVLDLVDSRDNGRLSQQLLEVLLAVLSGC
jgi:hypothetical protein